MKLNAVGGAFQAVMSEDGDVTSACFLQHSGADQRLAFSFVGVRALANTVGQPVADQWQHLVGVRHVTNSKLSIYVDAYSRARWASSAAAKREQATLKSGRGKFGGNPSITSTATWTTRRCSIGRIQRTRDRH